MNKNEQILLSFYQAFNNKDYKTMQMCYDAEAIFNDPVFTNLNATEAGAMWEMFCVNGKDLQIDYSNIKAYEKN